MIERALPHLLGAVLFSLMGILMVLIAGRDDILRKMRRGLIETTIPRLLCMLMALSSFVLALACFTGLVATLFTG